MTSQTAPTSAAARLPGNDAAPPAGPRKGRLILVAILAGTVAVAGNMWWRSHYFEETDNAYLAAHISMVAPRIPGVVTRVLVDDNQLVKAGDPLLELDPADQQVKIDQIRAQLAQTDDLIRQSSEQFRQGQAEALAAKALVARAGAQLRRHDAEARRVQALYDSQAMSVSASELENALAARDSSVAEVRAQEYQAQAAQARCSATEAARAVAESQKKVLAAQLRDAELQLQYTRIVAPVSGRVGRKNVEVGTRLQAGQHLLAIVQDGVWINANFKENQLGEVHVGQAARIRIDAFPGVEFSGRIDSISPAAGAQFALLPPDNATGNFTRIAQRIPVKIVLDAESLRKGAQRLAPGTSAIVEIDLRQGKPAGQAERT